MHVHSRRQGNKKGARSEWILSSWPLSELRNQGVEDERGIRERKDGVVGLCRSDRKPRGPVRNVHAAPTIASHKTVIGVEGSQRA